MKPRAYWCPRTSLLTLENTHNRGGGLVWDQVEAARVCEAARARGINSFLDGARLWNASVASGLPVFAAMRPNARSVTVSQGKGLTRDAARVSALMEAVESWHAETIEAPLRLASAAELAPGGGPRRTLSGRSSISCCEGRDKANGPAQLR